MTTKKKDIHNPLEAGKILLAVSTTESQREIWSTTKINENASKSYIESLQLNLNGRIDSKILQKAYDIVLSRHDSLHGTFSKNGKYFLVKEEFSQKINSFDFSLNTDSKLKQFLNDETDCDFDLVKGPLTRASLIKIESNRHIFVFSAHHIVCDGWSIAIVLTELSEIYNSLLSSINHDLEWPIQFYEYATKQKIEPLSHKEFWKNKFSDNILHMEIPLSFERPSFRTYESDRLDVQIDKELVKKIKKIGARNGCSFYTTLMTGFSIFLSKLSKSENVIYGISAAAQSSAGQENLVGHLVNLLPMYETINGRDSLKDSLRQIKSSMMDAFENQSYTFGSLLKDITIERDPSRIPLVNIIFNVDQQYPGQGMEFNGLDAHYTTVPRHYENFELFFNMVTCGDNLLVECQFNTNLFSRDLVLNWINSYVDVLTLLTVNLDITIDSILLNNKCYTQLLDLKIKHNTTTKHIPIENIDTDIKVKLTNIWEQALGFEDIPSDISFFSIGGHSILGLDIIAQIELQLDKVISLKDLFENPTIDKLSSLLSIEGETVKVFDNKNIKAEPQSSHPVTVKQMGVIYQEQLNEDTTMHNLPSAFHIHQNLDINIFSKAVEQIVGNHPSLRSTFQNNNNIYTQVVKDKSDINIKFKVQEITEDKLQDKLQSLTTSTFNLEDGPLFKIEVFKLKTDHYVIFFMVHHIIWDGWCFDIFFDELDNIYSELLKGNKPIGSIETLSYSEYAIWQKDFLSSAIAKDEIDFWVEKLSLPLPVLEFPIDKIRPIDISHNGKSVDFSLNKEQTLKLKSLARKENVSFFNILLSSFKLVLAKFSADEEIIMGTPVRSRPTAKLNNTIGYFVNIVAIRSVINRELTFKELIQNITHNTNEAISKDNVPFEIISNILKLDRDTSRTPVFQTFFSFQDISNRANEFNGEKKKRVILDKASAHTDIDLSVRAAGELTEFLFEYRTDLFKNETIIRLQECLCFVLNNLESLLNEKVASIDILPNNQKRTLLEDWNNTNVKNDKRPFIKLIEDSVKKYPTYLAVQDDNVKLTYKELEDESNCWANKLISMGVKPGDNVGLSTDRNAHMIVSLLAILKTGAGYIPLEPSFPQDRLDYMIESSGLNTMLVQDHLGDRFNSSLNKLSIDELKHATDLDSSKVDIKVSLEDTCYIIYTSGSTGLPKGVELLHGSVTNFLQSMAKSPGLKAKDSLLAVTTLSFDIAVLELYLPLLVGGSVYIASKEQTIDGEELKKIIQTNKINTMQATPSTWRLLLASEWQGDKDFKVLCGGEPFPKDLAQKLCPIAKEVWNMYGPTETTVWSTCHKVSLSDLKMYIGKPIDNTGIFILDENLRALPIGATGEMYISGDGLANGYKGREDLTDAVFVKSPYLKNLSIYNTGDLARYHFDGKLECLGRNDGQVKVRGYRIELGEIESIISKFSGIIEAVVVTREDIPGDVRIVAYLRIESEKLDQIGIRKFIANLLPTYMIPAHFVLLDTFPKTLNEKIDKKKLKSNDHRPGRLSKTKIETKTIEVTNTKIEVKIDKKISTKDMKSDIRNIWKDILEVDFIDDSVDFYTLGGNSISMLNIISIIKNEMKFTIKLKDFLKNNTINSLFAHIESSVEDRFDVKSENIKIDDLNDIPANENQTKIFYFSKYYGSSNLYNLPSGMKCSKHIEKELLDKAFNILIERHEILRTNFIEKNDDVYQVVRHIKDLTFSVHELNIKETDVLDEIHSLKSRIFDFESDLLFEFKLFQIENNQSVLFFMPHHIIWDGQSFDIYFKELNEIYSSLLKNESPKLELIEMTYQEYVVNQKKYLTSKQADSDIDYWKNIFSTIPEPTNFPHALSRPAEMQNVGVRLDFQVKLEISNKIKNIACSNNMTVFSFVFGAYNLFLSNFLKRSDIIIGVPVTGRPDYRLDHTMGYFVNSLPIYSKIDKNINKISNIKNIFNNFIDAFDNQRMPFDAIIRNLNIVRDQSRTPLYQTFFTFKETKDDVYNFCGNKTEYYKIDRSATHTDLDISVISNYKGLNGYFDYREDLFDSKDMDNFKSDWLSFLDNLVLEFDQLNESKPSNSFEEKLKMIWSDILGYSEIDLTSDFFLLGGHSIMAFKMFSQIEKEFNQKILFKDFFADPTFFTICNLLEKKIQNNPQEIVKKNKELIGTSGAIDYAFTRPAGFNQKSMHFSEVLTTETTPNNLPIALKVFGEIDLDLFEKSINLLINRHESLRTSFDILNDELCYTVHPSGQIKYSPEYHSLSEDLIVETIKQNSCSRFNLSQAPLLKCKLFNVNDNMNVVFLMFHHITWDGTSFDLLKRDLSEIYKSLLSNKLPDLKTIKNNFSDFIDYENNFVSSKEYHSSETFWSKHLKAPIPILELPSDMIRPDQMTYTGDLAQFKIKKELKEKLEIYAKARGVSLFNLFLTVFKVTLSSFSNSKDIVVGTPVNGRPSSDFDNTTGYFVNTIPIRSTIDLTQDFITNLNNVRDNLYECLEHKMVPFEKIYRLCNIERDISRTPIFQTIFSFIDHSGDSLPFIGDRSDHVLINRNATHTDLDLWLNKHNNIINGNIQFYNKAYRKDTVQNIIDLFIVTLENITNENPKSLLSIMPHHDNLLNSKIAYKVQSITKSKSVISNKYEIELLEIWKDLLISDDVSIDDNFFEIGGHSLLAVILFNRINNFYKVNIKLASLFLSPTIKELAILIQTELGEFTVPTTSNKNDIVYNFNSPIFQSLVPIRSTGDKTPIFMFHSVGGNVLNYAKLATGIDSSHPVFGFQSKGVDGFSSMDKTIEKMAESYIIEIKLISPKGPYILCGGSMGGSIALEVAIQLEKAGDNVHKLIMFDTFGPNVNIKKLKDEGNKTIKNLKTSVYYRSMTLINKMRSLLLNGLGIPIPHSIRYFNIEMNNYKAMWSYKPGVFNGDLILFRAPVDSSGWYSDPLMGWKNTIVGDIKTIPLIGNHNNFVEIDDLPMLLNKEINN